MNCKGICPKFKAVKPPVPESRYGVGQKRCNNCGIFINWDGKNCPCCGCPLRTKPREGNSRKKLLEEATRI